MIMEFSNEEVKKEYETKYENLKKIANEKINNNAMIYGMITVQSMSHNDKDQQDSQL